jgi:hypothetical protein
MAWWVTPAILGGVMMYAKSKASAAFRWIMSTEASVKSMPIALLLTKVSTGDSLPAVPSGFRWKALEYNFASSPFATPQSLIVNVLEEWLNGAAKANGITGFLTTQEVLPAAMHGFLDKETFAMSPHMGEVLDRSQYLYAPQTAPDFGDMLQRLPNVGNQLGDLGQELRAKGLLLAPVGPEGIRAGDHVVTWDHAIWIAEGNSPGTFKARQVHPIKGKVGALGPTDIQCAYGVRRA